MSVLFETVYYNECRSTHHKLAMDALRHLRDKHAEHWLRLFLRYYEDYLEGAKDPDKKFRDFRNHVLHVTDNYWGGAVKAATKWYDRAVESLVKQDWTEGVYCIGVLSHYYTDVLMPFHTGQTEEEGKVHRAFEWSVCKSYDDILPLVTDYPAMETPSGDQWLQQMIHSGAEEAQRHYQVFVDEYDLERGRKKPKQGLNDDLKQRLATLFSHAIVGQARIMERIFQDAQVKPPTVRIGVMGLLTKLTSPFGKFGQYTASRKDKKVVAKIYKEWVRTGCVIDSLPEDDREIRRMHAEEVLGIAEEELNRLTLEAAAARMGQGRDEQKQQRAEAKAAAKAENKAKKARKKEEARAAKQAKQPSPAPADVAPQDDDSGPATVKITRASTGTPAPSLRFHLDRNSPVVDAPSIGGKTAKRFGKIGVQTVDDLLAVNPEEAAEQLNSSYMTAEAIRQWQAQAALVCRIPNLRGHDAQMLVGSNMTDPQLIANMAPGELLDRVEEFLLSEEGERLLQRTKEPDREEVTDWIRWAGQSRKLAAA